MSSLLRVAKKTYSTAISLLTRTDKYLNELVAFAVSYFTLLPFLTTEKDGYLSIESSDA